VLIAAEEGRGVVGDPVHGKVGGDPVGQFQPDSERVRLIGQEVDEPGGDDPAGRIPGLEPVQRFEREIGDDTAVDADVDQPVEAGFGIDDQTRFSAVT
ncbi:MAG: hypothetical protein F6J94_30075, partial [Moorea sp. SIO1F2]|uniref:hypothetical protein n=1 Tax=Moorena sp. SIO1F2 TaxID=2607819 RepID=UPI0013BE27C2